MVTSLDLRDLLSRVRSLMEIVEGLLAKAEEAERAALTRVGAPAPRLTRRT